MAFRFDLVDVAIVALLLACLVYGYILSRRLERLRRVLLELGPALQAYVNAVDRSEDAARLMSRMTQGLQNSPKRASDKSDEVAAFWRATKGGTRR
jgi:hypothetical protein